MTLAGIRSRLLAGERQSLRDVELIAAILSAGDSSRGQSALGMAQWLLDQAGGLSRLLWTDRIPRRFDLGPTLGYRMAAAAQITIRVFRDPEIRGAVGGRTNSEILDQLLADPSVLAESELIAAMLGHATPDAEGGRALFNAAGGLAELLHQSDSEELPPKLAARLVALSEVVRRFQVDATNHETRVVDLALALLEFGARTVDAVSRQPEPQVLTRAAELMQQVYWLGADLVDAPDLEAICQALDRGAP